MNHMVQEAALQPNFYGHIDIISENFSSLFLFFYFIFIANEIIIGKFVLVLS